MANIIIVITSIQATDNGDELDYSCTARCSTMTVQNPTVFFNAFIFSDATAPQINDAVKNAGIAAVGQAGFLVAPADKKIIIGGAVAVQ